MLHPPITDLDSILVACDSRVRIFLSPRLRAAAIGLVQEVSELLFRWPTLESQAEHRVGLHWQASVSSVSTARGIDRAGGWL